jgi:ammonia channel protein AmtB
MLLGERLAAALDIDDPKIGPLALGPAIFSALLAGIVGRGIPTGGLPGLTGAYGFQHARISLGMQAIGVIFTLGVSAVTGLLLAFLLERTTGLQATLPSGGAGLDAENWGIYPAGRAGE